MMSVDECVRKAWDAILRGDYAERDRWVAMATNAAKFAQRVDHDMPPLATEGIELHPVCGFCGKRHLPSACLDR